MQQLSHTTDSSIYLTQQNKFHNFTWWWKQIQCQ